MADTKISALTDGVTANSTDTIPAARSGVNVYVTPAYIRTFMLGLNNVWTANGALSSGAGPGATFNGTWITGGSATTTKPYFLIEPTGTTSTGWSTNGTALGINADNAFTGNLIDVQKNGTSQFKVTSSGRATFTDSVFAPNGFWINGNGGSYTIGAAQDGFIVRDAAGIWGIRGAGTTSPGALSFYTYGASPPSAPAASIARLYSDTSGGKIRLMALFPSGAAQQIAIEP